MAVLHPAFQLIEGGRTYGAVDIAPVGGVIDVAKTGAAGVIGGLAALEATGEDCVLLRDGSAGLPQTGSSGQLWLQTSGTTGTPKWASHALANLERRIAAGNGERARWLLTFNPGSFAGVQVILSAMKGGHDLVAPDYGAGVAAMAELAVAEAVTHISGTPTFWRAFLMALGEGSLPLRAITLGGEAVDQALLDALKQRFSVAIIRHIYASTEAGSVFSVSDGRAGFPVEWIDNQKLAISDRGTLMVHGRDSGDVVETDGDRILFRGRIDAMVNVGGVKVYPEQVEAHLLQLSCVHEVSVTARPNPITGQMLVADIVSQPFSAEVPDDIKAAVKAHLAALPRSHRPASIRYVESIAVSSTGKKQRI